MDFCACHLASLGAGEPHVLEPEGELIPLMTTRRALGNIGKRSKLLSGSLLCLLSDPAGSAVIKFPAGLHPGSESMNWL